MELKSTNIKNECRIIELKSSKQSTWKQNELDFLENPESLEKELIYLDSEPVILVRKKN